MARFVLLAAIVLAMAGSAYWLGLKSRDQVQARQAVGAAAPAVVPGVGQTSSAELPVSKPAAAPPLSRQPAASRPASPGLSGVQQPITRTSLAQMNARAMQQIEEIDAKSMPDFEARVRTGDGEAAFALFHKAMACANAPETEGALLGRIDDIYQGAQDNPDAEKMMDQLSEHFVQKFEDCADFPRGLAGMLLALDWLQAAIDLGFPPAHGAYITYGKSIVQRAALRRPDLVQSFRVQALSQLQNLLATGHPEAFMVHSREYASGELLEQDWFLSYAHAHAHGLANSGDSSGEFLAKEAERHLSPDQVRDAREQGRELCDRYCR